MDLTFTLDFENHRGNGDGRYADNARRILDFLDERSVRATIFIVGELIDRERTLIARACDAGHEPALHSFRHVPLTAEHRDHYQARLAAAKSTLEDVSGQAVTGYRAPVFSLTAETCWVLPMLQETGIEYSSSVLPARHPLYGFANAPRRAFRWPQGLVELPVPLARFAGIDLPFLGGIYLRYLPNTVVNVLLRRLAAEQPRWSYVHPYDIDAEEPYYRFPGTSTLMSWLLWRNRKGTLAKLGCLAEAAPVGAPFAERVAAGEFSDAPVFEPDSMAFSQ